MAKVKLTSTESKCRCGYCKKAIHFLWRIYAHPYAIYSLVYALQNGAGSIVTKDIPANVFAVGNPCRVLREINAQDREYFFKDRKLDISLLK